MRPESMAASTGIYLSAPGKIILFGEHAVVYGRTAVAGSIDMRTYVSLFTSADGRIYLCLPDLGVEKTWMLKDLARVADKLSACVIDDGSPPSLEAIVPLARRLSGSSEEQCGVQHLAILAFWYLLLGVAQRKRWDLLAVKLTIRFKLPSCVGLGSSGAYCVCIAAALLRATGLVPEPTVAVGDGNVTWHDAHLDMIRKWASSAESLIHGRASGLDAAVCTYGGVASFKPGTRIQHLRNLPNLKVILVNSKVERNTSRMVQVVKERLKSLPTVVEAIFDSIDAISQEAVRLLNRGETASPQLNGASSSSSAASACTEDEHRAMQAASADGAATSAADQHAYLLLNDLCRINNQLLIALGVGHPKVDQISTLLARYGIHPKMTGAGGGGSVYAFLKPDTSQTIMDMIANEIESLDYELWQPPLGGAGLVCHRQKPDVFKAPVKSATAPATCEKPQ